MNRNQATGILGLNNDFKLFQLRNILAKTNFESSEIEGYSSLLNTSLGDCVSPKLYREECHILIKDYLFLPFTSNWYGKCLSAAFGVKMKQTLLSINADANSSTLRLLFTSDDQLTCIMIEHVIYHTQLRVNPESVNSSGIDLKAHTFVSAMHDGLALKLIPRRFLVSSVATILNPTGIVTKDKIAKAIRGRAKSGVKKADFEALFKHGFSLERDGNFFFKSNWQAGDHYQIHFERFTSMKTGSWRATVTKKTLGYKRVELCSLIILNEKYSPDDHKGFCKSLSDLLQAEPAQWCGLVRELHTKHQARQTALLTP